MSWLVVNRDCGLPESWFSKLPHWAVDNWPYFFDPSNLTSRSNPHRQIYESLTEQQRNLYSTSSEEPDDFIQRLIQSDQAVLIRKNLDGSFDLAKRLNIDIESFWWYVDLDVPEPNEIHGFVLDLKKMIANLNETLGAYEALAKRDIEGLLRSGYNSGYNDNPFYVEWVPTTNKNVPKIWDGAVELYEQAVERAAKRTKISPELEAATEALAELDERQLRAVKVWIDAIKQLDT